MRLSYDKRRVRGGLFRQKIIRGWYRVKVDTEVNLTIVCRGASLDCRLSYHSRPDLKEFPNSVVSGFRIELNDALSYHEFICETELRINHRADAIEANKYRLIEIAGAIDAISGHEFSQVLPMLERSKRAEFATTLRDYFTPWKPLNNKKKACVVTYANSSKAWFDIFYEHYTNLVGKNSIYVITPNADDFKDYLLAGVISLPDAPYSDSPRAQLISGIVSGLSAYHEYVIICDVDEFIICNPRLGGDLFDILDCQSGSGPFVGVGIDVIEQAGEPPVTFGPDIIHQRQYGIINSAMCKPMIHTGVTRLCMGHHFCERNPKIDPGNPLYFNLHMKYACSEIRAELIKSLQKISYEDENIASYAANSLSQEHHPFYLSASRNSPVSIGGVEVVGFISDWISSITQNEYTGHYVADHRVLPRLVNLQSIASKSDC